jgi:hypothetical protein
MAAVAQVLAAASGGLGEYRVQASDMQHAVLCQYHLKTHTSLQLLQASIAIVHMLLV